ncbi:major capsid protein [Spartinivicinus ruber]|uniref:major capsid protein n=1 Tax=Spartinivicinus ruber TaxID=2683272 RepID=UPI002E2F4F51|nr:major capsid protein [Spartinivicinus ruber]
MFQMNNPFDDPSFSMASMTAAINLLPSMPSRAGAFFTKTKPVSTRTILVEERSGVLELLQTQELGSTSQTRRPGKRKIRSFVIPHIPLDTSITAADYQGLRGFGTNRLQALSQLVTENLQGHRDSHEITKQYLCMGALKGQILDGDGTLLYDLFREFGIQKKIIHFALDNKDTSVPAKCRELKRYLEQTLMGESMSKVQVEISPEFFEKLIAHASVKEIYLNHAAAVTKLGGDPRDNFPIGGVTFRENTEQALRKDGSVYRFIDEEKGLAIPVGTRNTFFMAYAPADFNETANTLGKPYYAKMAPRKYNRGMDLHSQCNPLPMCARPGILVEVDAGAG